MQDHDLVDVGDASRLTGLDKTTLYRLARERRVRSFKVLGTALRFDPCTNFSTQWRRWGSILLYRGSRGRSTAAGGMPIGPPCSFTRTATDDLSRHETSTAKPSKAAGSEPAGLLQPTGRGDRPVKSRAEPATLRSAPPGDGASLDRWASVARPPIGTPFVDR